MAAPESEPELGRPVVVLVGLPGSGKSTVGGQLATELDVPFRDTDTDIEASSGRTVSDLFVESGEPHFRELEAAAVQAAFGEHRGVLALGGGAVMNPSTREALASQLVVFLDVGLAAAMQRLEMNRSRPLLLGNIRSQWQALAQERRPLYLEVSDLTVQTDNRSVDDVVREISSILLKRRHTVTSEVIKVTGSHPYEIVVGRQLLAELPRLLGQRAERVAVIHPRALAQTGEAVRLDLAAQGRQAIAIEVPDAEAAKSSQVAAFCWSVLGQNNFTRSDAVVGVGGGATTDLAGFVAATWLRGVKLVQIPTTLLGMVDAAVGGKTGINTDEGKNLVGAFHPPVGVLCDLTTLETLPRNDYVAGLAEAVKVGFTHDSSILELLEGDLPAALNPTTAIAESLILKAIAVKARVVSADLHESGQREFLNYGHTLGHAIEKVERYQWRHGAAISVGMVFAAELGRLTGPLTTDAVQQHRRILGSLGLPTTYRGDAWPALLETMRVDKKARGSMLRFIVLEDIGRPTTLDGPDPTLLAAAYAEVSQ